MDKDSLRRSAKARRLKRSTEDVDKLSSKIIENFEKAIDWLNISTIHSYVPIEQMKEPNTWQLLDYLYKHRKKIKVYTNKMIDNQVESVLVDKNTEFDEDMRGIPEPVSSEIAGPLKLDVIAVPLLAFDLQLHRLGYGSGFYDRLLAKHPESLKVGIAFDDDKVELVDQEWHDIGLNKVVTDKNIYDREMYLNKVKKLYEST